MISSAAREVGRWPVPGATRALPSAVRLPSGVLRLTVAERDAVRVFELGETAAEVGRFRFPVGFPAYAISPDLDFVVFAGPGGLRVWNTDGSARWQRGHDSSVRIDLLVSSDSRYVWVSLPGDDEDRWQVFDAADGSLLDEITTGTSGWGSHLRHPDGRHVAVGIGEGQEGGALFWGRFEDGQLHYWRAEDDLVPAAISPAGDRYLTVDHGQDAATLHAFPSGKTVWRAPGDLIDREPHEDEDDLMWDYYAGFVDDDTVLLSDVEYDIDERAGHYLVDARTGDGIGEVDYPVEVYGYPHPLGDGTWLTAEDDATVVRWTLQPSPAST